MATKLKELYYRTVALVDQGANQFAKIVLMKRDTAPPASTKEPTMAEPNAADATVAKLAKLEADQAALQKRLDESEAARVKAEKDASDKQAASAAEIAKATERSDRQECISKAGALKNLGAADDLGGVLYDIKRAAPAEAFAKLETLLKSANEQLRVNKLFVSIGADGDGDTGSASQKLDRLAKAYAKEKEVSFASAYDTVLKTAEGAALYAEHSKAMKGER